MISKVEDTVQLSGEYRRPSGFAAAGDTIPFLLDDTYHLFHLASPPNTVHHPSRVRCTWVRLRSKNLIQWTRDAKPVIAPGDCDSDPDRSGAWTGSAVLGPDGNMHIFYTGYNLPDGGKQVILHAESSDRQGSKFEKPLGSINIDPSSSLDKYESTDFRDPYVFFNEVAAQYWMVVATRLSEGPYWTRGCLALLTSSDLETWVVQDEPLYAPNNIFCPECPEIFTLGNGKWYLVYSRFSAPNAGTLYVVADSPYGPYRSPRDGADGRFDGRRWYAAKSCPKRGDPSRRVAFAWVHDWNEKDGKWLWGGSLAQPREISAAADGSLVVTPNLEFLHLLQGAVLPAGKNFPTELRLGGPGAQTAVPLPVAKRSQNTIYNISFRVDSPDAKSFGVLLDFDDDLRGYRITLEHIASNVYSVALVTDLPPLDDFWAQLTRHHIPKLVDGPELVRHSAVRLDDSLRLVTSENVIEFFVGGKVITYRLPPREKHSIPNGHTPTGPSEILSVHPVGLFVEDGQVDFKNLTFTYADITA